MKPVLYLMLASVALSSCNAPEIQQSGIDAPTLWARLTGEQEAPAKKNVDTPLIMDAKATIDHQWWMHFGDPTLDMLMQQALDNNKTLQIAKARVEEARAGRMAANALLYPQIDGTAGVSRANQGALMGDKAVTIKEAGLQASWELDLFGRNRARSREAAAVLQSQEANEHAVRVALLAEVARNYFDMRNFEQQVAITRKNLDTQRKTLEITKAQLAGALLSELDVQRAAAQVSTTESQLPTLQAAYEASLNRLNVLVGVAPGAKDALLKTAEPLRPLDQNIVVAAPATVLATRPDVAAAERNFAATIAARDAASAEMFPNISLLAFFGVQDSSLGSASPWSLGASLVQPILNFGRIEAQIDAADARQKQAFLGYQQVVLEALEDMENALSRYAHENERNRSLSNAVAQNRKATALAKNQFENGYTDLLDVLVAERNSLQAESELAASDAKLRTDLTAIYTAAGGGWDLSKPAPKAEPKMAPKPASKLVAEPTAAEPVPFKKASDYKPISPFKKAN